MVKTLCVPCFPPHYDIVNKFVHMYHSSLSHHVSIFSQCCGLERGMEGGNRNTIVVAHYWSRERVHCVGQLLTLINMDTFLSFSLALKLCYYSDEVNMFLRVQDSIKLCVLPYREFLHSKSLCHKNQEYGLLSVYFWPCSQSFKNRKLALSCL